MRTPTAFASVGASRAAKVQGLQIPDDLAVIGFNNFNIAAATTPSLTTIDFPAYQLGMTAAELLLRHLVNDPVETKEVVLPVSLFASETA